MNSKKVELGQFFTEKNVWLQPQVVDFIKSTNIKKIIDPFAGSGCLFNALKDLGFNDFKGLDVDERLEWEINDSLSYIKETNRLVVTNPPYLAKNSATRKALNISHYFKDNTYSDLYLIALEKSLENHDYVVAIIPETFILTNLFTDRLDSVTVLEDNPFNDTEFPVCVVCFTKETVKETKVYKNSTYIGLLEEIKKKEKKPNKIYDMKFNIPTGNVGLRGVDSANDKTRITFCLPSELNYDPNKIKHSSRSISIIELNETVPIQKVIDKANELIESYREDTYDILMAAFKGNTKKGKRRRRLDFKTARAILEEAIEYIKKDDMNV